jgi:ATP synthase protein I
MLHPIVRWVLFWQTATTVFVALLSLIVGSAMNAGVSALLGGGIGMASSAAYAWRAMRKGSAEPRKAFQAQVLGEGYKFAVTILLFALVFVGYRDLVAMPLFVAYVLTFVVYWAALLKHS